MTIKVSEKQVRQRRKLSEGEEEREEENKENREREKEKGERKVVSALKMGRAFFSLTHIYPLTLTRPSSDRGHVCDSLPDPTRPRGCETSGME